ncbi:MAG TPA: homoserine dehydrogenase [Lachnospiraceae bacterium]|nr:homoserine dehydrogenase [Lachnospiraceae bacterium]
MTGVAILGFGTVGSGVYDVINTNSGVLELKSGDKIEVKKVLDLRDFPGNPVEKVLTKDFEEILNDPDIGIIAEAMGGVEPAFTFTKRALAMGKSVVTSNKELVAKHGPELMKLARTNGVSYLFEASVGGGIPIIRPLCVSLAADEILEISGILNGTTNYILTKMTEEGKSFDEVLKDAQQLGYAEANPAADVEGHDACRKIAILSSLAFGETVNYEHIYTEGITKITHIDIEYSKKLNCLIKLIGSSKKSKNGISAKVSPCLISKEHPLSAVNGVYNAIFVKGNMSGNTMYYGSGAGKLPTASAVVADIVDAVRHKGLTVNIGWDCDVQACVADIKEADVKAMIRIASDNFEAAKKSIIEVFGDVQFVDLDVQDDEFAIITNEETEGSMAEKVEKIATMSGVGEIRNLIRMEA